jgi:hypothetical protein
VVGRVHLVDGRQDDAVTDDVVRDVAAVVYRACVADVAGDDAAMRDADRKRIVVIAKRPSAADAPRKEAVADC